MSRVYRYTVQYHGMTNCLSLDTSSMAARKRRSQKAEVLFIIRFCDCASEGSVHYSYTVPVLDCWLSLLTKWRPRRPPGGHHSRLRLCYHLHLPDCCWLSFHTCRPWRPRRPPRGHHSRLRLCYHPTYLTAGGCPSTHVVHGGQGGQPEATTVGRGPAHHPTVEGLVRPAAILCVRWETWVHCSV